VIAAELAGNSWIAGKEIFLASMIGTIWGTVMNFLFLSWITSADITHWLLVIRVPIAVVLTIYTLFFIGKPGPGAQTAGMY
jgi:hypothetical protein